VGWSGDEDRNNGELGRGQVLVSCSSLIHACMQASMDRGLRICTVRQKKGTTFLL